MNRTIARTTLLVATATLSTGALLGASPVFAANYTSTTFLQAGASAPELHAGSSGEDVRAWQRDLNLLSSEVTGIPSVTIDGVYGRQTASVTRDMQRYTKVTVDGVVGPRTRAAMDRAIHRVPAGTSTNLGTGSRGSAVRAWQSDLDRLAAHAPGLKTVTRDGIFGPQTVAATLAFQHFANLGQDGVVTPQVRTAMAKALHTS